MIYDFQFGQQSQTATKPTVGRSVWYWPQDSLDDDLVMLLPEQPFDAKVLYVYEEGWLLNLLVTDHVGNTKFRPQVPLFDLPDADESGIAFLLTVEATYYLSVRVDTSHGIATWMPYQAKQHAKQSLEDAAESLMFGETAQSLMPESSQPTESTGQIVGTLPGVELDAAHSDSIVLTDGRDV